MRFQDSVVVLTVPPALGQAMVPAMPNPGATRSARGPSVRPIAGA